MRARDVYSVCRLTPNVRATSAFGMPMPIIACACSTSVAESFGACTYLPRALAKV